MDVVFAPDWRNGVPYQTLLAEALERQGARVKFLQGYKRVLPLTRLLAQQRCDLLHLHWPEAYYSRRGDAWDWFRRARFVWDLRGATRRCALATTAHNLHAHNRGREMFQARNSRAAHQQAGVVFAHSEIAKERLIERFKLPSEKILVIPHGDLSVTLGAPIPAAEARAALGLPAGKVALVFGAVEPYKGQEEIIQWWRQHTPDATLAIVGNASTPAYREHIERTIAGDPRIRAEFGWLPDERLRLWLSAVDATIFNYREIFTSGAANLARSWGVPMVLPHRLDTVALDEPNPFVHRFASFETDFGTQLAKAFAVQPDFSASAAWRHETRWDRVAEITIAGYRRAMERSPARRSLLAGA